jgi:hypothetical protein
MKSTLLSEAKDGRVTVTLRMPFDEASMLLDVVTDSVMNGFTRGAKQEWAERLMKDLDDHLQRNEGSQEQVAPRCPNCGMYGVTDETCRNCGEVV